MKDHKPKPTALPKQSDLEAIVREELLSRSIEIARSIEERVRKLNQAKLDQSARDQLPPAS